MEIFKGKIETKCIEVDILGATSTSIQNLGVTTLTVEGNTTHNGSVDFYNDVYIGSTLSVNHLNVSSAVIEHLSVSGTSEFYTGVSFYGSVYGIDITTDGINGSSGFLLDENGDLYLDGNLFISGVLTSSSIESNNINTFALDVSGPVEFYNNVSFYGNVFGITSESFSINGASGFLLDGQGDLYVGGDLIVDGAVCGKIGQPTNDTIPRPIDISGTTFTTDIGLNLDQTMKIADGFQIIDFYFKTYFLCPPPGVSLVGCTTTAEDISIEWENFPKIEYAPMDIYLPHVIENRIDYVQSSLNLSQDWSHPSTITIHTTSRETNKVIFHTQGSGSGLDNITWNEYTINSSIPYDFRIYGVNNHSGQPVYLNIFNKATSDIGVPGAPTTFSISSPTQTSVNTSWVKPIDHDIITSGNNVFPIIERYAVDFEASASVRYPSFISLSGTSFTTITTDPTNSSTSLVISGLNPGTEYTMSVSAKNAINPSYGAESNTSSLTTVLPSKPPLLETSHGNALHNLATLRAPYPAIGGFSLNGLIPISTIIRFSNINDSVQPIRTIVTPNVRNNEIPGTTSGNTATLTAYGGLETDYQINDVVSQNINGYGFATSIGNYNNTAKVQLRIDSDQDYYSSPSNGFYKSYSMWAQGLSSALYFPASVNEYVLGLRYESLQGGPMITTNPVNFYIDNLDSVPSVSHAHVIDEISPGSTGAVYISGVPTYTRHADFKIQFSISEIAHYFLRNDKKHAEVLMETSENISLSSTLVIDQADIGITHKYYSRGSNTYQTSTTLHNTDGLLLAAGDTIEDIQFNTFNIPLTTNAIQKFNEDFRLQVTPFNLYGTGTSINGTYVDTATGNISKLRIDTLSIANDRSNSMTTEILGRHVLSGLGQYPDIGTTQVGQAGGDYDHSLDITTLDELQLVKGTYQTPVVGDGYKNYNLSSPNNYFFPDVYGFVFPDYSGIQSGVTVRYTTFKYTGVIPQGTTRERLRFTINNTSGLIVNFSQFDQANHQMWLRVLDIGDGTDLQTHTTTEGWMDCTNTVSQNGVLTGTNGTRCINGGTSTASQRDCFIRPGTTENAIIYIRIGLPQNINAKFASISCVAIDGIFT